MIYRIVNLTVYIVSFGLALYGLSCFRFDQYLRKNTVKQFYVFYLMASVAIAYLFAQFILNFGTWTLFMS